MIPSFLHQFYETVFALLAATIYLSSFSLLLVPVSARSLNHLIEHIKDSQAKLLLNNVLSILLPHSPPVLTSF